MQYISSQAGTRLAKAKAELDDALQALTVDNGESSRRYSMAHYDFCQAANALADELIEQGFHKIEGN